ncbi:MAG: transposase domain-containing protein [Cyanobacteriota bacterium]|nr:transposase domain-containing protein [Cyanobacteriota bacterium]
MTELNKNSQQESWVDPITACNLLSITYKTLKNKCHLNQLNYTVKKTGKKCIYFIDKNSLAEYMRIYCNNKNIINPKRKYSEAPAWAKTQAEKYISILKSCSMLKGKALKNFIALHNENNPNSKTSYSSITKMRKRYEKFGIDGLLANYDSNARTTVKQCDFDYFKNLYLVEGAPSLKSCWEQTYGHALSLDASVNKYIFPSYMAFKRRLEKEIPVNARYLARYGASAYKKKFENYIERDYSTISCGKVWVSDHAQIDVAVFDPEGNVVFPWVTAWRDYKSGKWLGWILQCGSPNSDRIFQAFYYAAEKFGLPEDVIIDNGKDYRCKDFAGGRKIEKIKIQNDKNKTSSMLDELNVNVHFALPYNAQTKPIERDFLKLKEILSKHVYGYRGGNVVERPERLAQEIKTNKIYDFERFKTVFNDYIINVLNKKPSDGKNHNGLSPDELFDNEFNEIIKPTREALKLFCTRTSRNFTIARNGIKDRQLEITYWADWMISQMSVKVYLRRDPENYKEAWVFRLDNDEFLGKCTAVKAVAALHANEVSKEEFKDALAIKKHSLKLTKAYLDNLEMIPIEEQCNNYKLAYAKKEKESKPKVTIIANTPMDKAIRKNKDMEAFGKNDLTMFMPDETQKEEDLYLFETDLILDEELKGVANGGY